MVNGQSDDKGCPVYALVSPEGIIKVITLCYYDGLHQTLTTGIK
jgi:hypothetical protein